VAVGYALVGLVAGTVVAFWAVSSAPVAANLLGTAAWLWALAIAGVVAGLVTNRDLDTYLTSWQFAETHTPVRYGGIYWPSAVLTLVAAFVIGLILAWPAARRGNQGLGTATSGSVGPLLVAVAFLSLAPLLNESAGPLQSAYLIAPYAVLAGLAGSALAVSLAPSRPTGPNRPIPNNPPPLPAGPTPAEPADATPAPAPVQRPAPKPSAPVQRPAPKPPAPPSAPTPKTESTSTSEQPQSSATEETPRRRWLFGRRRPAESVAETPAEPAEPAEPQTRTRKPRAKSGATEEATPAKNLGAKESDPGLPATRPAPATVPTPQTSGKQTGIPAEGLTDPEIAAAVRPGKNAAAKRAAARKQASARSTITPPPANPPVARINPKD
jgi:hypothetical protein